MDPLSRYFQTAPVGMYVTVVFVGGVTELVVHTFEPVEVKVHHRGEKILFGAVPSVVYTMFPPLAVFKSAQKGASIGS